MSLTGYQLLCKWRRANPEKLKAQRKRYRKRHQKRLRAWSLRYQKRNKKKIAAQRHRWYVRNPGRKVSNCLASQRFVERLPDSYVLRILRRGSKTPSSAFSPAIIHLKRSLLKLKRAIRHTTQQPVGKKNENKTKSLTNGRSAQPF